MFIRPKESDIQKLKEIHKEKGFNDFHPLIIMTLPIYCEERYQVLAEMPITEKPLENGYSELLHKEVAFGTIHYGSKGHQSYYLYAVQVIEQLYLKKGRYHERISERPLNKFRLICTSQRPTKKSLYKSWLNEMSISDADSLEGLRNKYKERFCKKTIVHS